MDRRVVMFLMTGAAHLPYLAVAVITLRRHYKGRVVIAALPESHPIAAHIARAVDAEAVCIQPEYLGKNSQEVAKLRFLPEFFVAEDRVVYLDADIMVQQPLDPLFEALEAPADLVATQFCDWTQANRIANRRVGRLVGIEGIDQAAVLEAMQPHQPSYNSGIFACRPRADCVATWADWTYASREIFISGECALHPVAVAYPDRVITLWGGQYNCSPKYKPRGMTDDQVGIWHFHGDSNVRPNKSQKGVDLWWPAFMQAMAQNIGGIWDWIDQIPNHYLTHLRQDLVC